MEILGRMLGLKRISAATALVVLLAAGCSGSGGDDIEPTEALPDTPVEIESVTELADTERYEVNGVSLLVPQNLEIMQETVGGDEVGDVTQVSFVAPGQDRASIILTVENIPDADIKNAEFSALALQNSLATSGVGSDIELSVLDWPDLGTGAAVSAALNVPLNDVDTDRESFTAIVPHEDLLISVSVETAPEELEDSQEIRALRTLQVAD